ncbi:hypothetical protein K488DRAFT_24690, partial [Vararia minispora EC-137]
TMQDHLHDPAKGLPPPRKQNIACDPCRQRKVKCHQIPGQPKCQHCTAKNYNCTYVPSLYLCPAASAPTRVCRPNNRHHAQQATSEKKRLNAAGRRPRALSSNIHSYSDQPSPPQPPPAAPASLPVSHSPHFGPPLRRDLTFPELLAHLFSPPESAKCAAFRLSFPRITVALPALPFPPFLSSPGDRLTDAPCSPQFPWQEWGELAHMLENESHRLEFALDLVNVYFQVVHARLPFLNPPQFRERLQSSTARTPPIPHPALVATVIAWGAKFSEHPLLVADRAASGSKESRLATTLVDRARELAEAFKVHRTPRTEHVVIGLMIESLQSRERAFPCSWRWRGFWLSSAIRQLFQLNINHKAVVSAIVDQEERGTMIFAWWFSCLADAYASAYYRRKPQIEDEDYDVDFYTAGPPSEQRNEKDPREHLETLTHAGTQGYYRAAHALARISRHMSRTLWIPPTNADGVPLKTLQDIMCRLQDWRGAYFAQVCVPPNLEAEWDFVRAVSACASDATFHVMWIILFNAIDDYGIREVNLQMRGPEVMQYDAQINILAEEHMCKLLHEALHGASRIAGLAGVLTKNGYLRLDPAIMHVSCQQAGRLLARFARPEVENCVVGLDQYAYSYAEAGDQARALERTYAGALNGEVEFAHMAGTIARAHQQP